MTPKELIAFGESRHGTRWIGPLADELGYSFSQVWRVAYDGAPATRRLVLELERVKKRKPKKRREVADTTQTQGGGERPSGREVE